MNIRGISRRQMFSAAGLAAGASLLAGCSEALEGAPPLGKTAPSGTEGASQPAIPQGRTWEYVRLDPAAIAADAYGLMPQGGCMYGVFASALAAMARLEGEPYRSFPVQMMKYGVGGVGNWGSLCGTLNGGAALIGLFVLDKERRERLIAELFSWYEGAELPKYCPDDGCASSPVPTSVARSVLCHVSAGRWCAGSGNDVGSPAMNERCRRLTADVTAKTVELLNANLREPCKPASLSLEVKSCLSCHSRELHDTIGRMRCTPCHQTLSPKHPPLKTTSSRP